ncbi:MAG: ATP-binding protein [Mycobacteriales bacterium]
MALSEAAESGNGSGQVPYSDSVSGSGSSAYDDLPDGILAVDSSGRVVDVNAAAATLLGQQAPELLGAALRVALPLRDLSDRDWWDVFEPFGGLQSRTRMPERLLILGGGPEAGRQLYVTARILRGPDRRMRRLIVSIRDAAARERQERDSADLVSTTAHELRSPLTSIKGFTATLLAKWERFNDEQRLHMLRAVNADADRVTRLITELLDVSRIEAGRLELRRRPVDLPALVDQVFAGLVAAGESADRFAVEETGPLPEIWADPDKLLQVLGNLIENAVRHGDGQVTVSIAGYGPQQQREGAEIVVSDQGRGISEEMRGRLFAMFSRGPRRGNTGLGLFIARGIVHAHGGDISAGRSADGGAAFRFTVPTGTPSFT